MAKNSYSGAVDMLNIIRSLNKPKLINEGTESNMDAIAITDDPKFGDKVLTNQIEQFKSAVDSSAQFANSDAENAANNPLIYMPNGNNIVFSGTIPRLDNLTWQFVLNETDGCYIVTKNMKLNKENLMVLNKLQGFYKNWCDQWHQSAKEMEQLKNLNK